MVWEAGAQMAGGKVVETVVATAEVVMAACTVG